MLRSSFSAISVCGATEAPGLLLDPIGLACADESVTGARGVAWMGLDCAAESVTGGLWVFCAVAASPATSTTATASHPTGTPNVIVRVTLSSHAAASPRTILDGYGHRHVASAAQLSQPMRASRLLRPVPKLILS